jgi:hypothetical protein
MKTNSMPYSDQPPGATPDNTRVGNFRNDDQIPTPYNDGYAVTGSSTYFSGINYLTDVGAYSSSPSYYGTFDQGGNVWEWDEAKINGSRGWRGGAWQDTLNYLQASTRFNIGTPMTEADYLGFRVASSVPEPSIAVLLSVGSVAAFLRRRKSVPHNRA